MQPQKCKHWCHRLQWKLAGRSGPPWTSGKCGCSCKPAPLQNQMGHWFYIHGENEEQRRRLCVGTAQSLKRQFLTFAHGNAVSMTSVLLLPNANTAVHHSCSLLQSPQEIPLEQAPAVVSLGTGWNGKEINKLICFQECIKTICETQPTHWGKGNVYNVVWEHGVQKELASAAEYSYLITKASQITKKPVPGISGTRKSHSLLFLSSSNLPYVFKIRFNSLHLEGLSSNYSVYSTIMRNRWMYSEIHCV